MALKQAMTPGAAKSSALPVNVRAAVQPQIILVLLVAAPLAVLWPVCGHEFTTWDDTATVAKNPTLNPPTADSLVAWWTEPRMDLYVPLTYTAWGVVAAIAQVAPDPAGIRLNPYIFHSVNLLVHVLTVLVVFQLLRRVVGRNWAACAGALLFALHPVQVEAVAWVSGLKDLLGGLFSLASLWQYMVAVDSDSGSRAGPWRSQRFWLATLLFACALLSKPGTLVTPIIAAIFDCLVKHRSSREMARWLWPWMVMAAACGVWTKLLQPAPTGANVAWWLRPLVAADALGFYGCKLLWPAALAIDYGHRPMIALHDRWIWLRCLGTAAVVLMAWLFRRRTPIIFAALLIFLTGLIPVLGLIRFDFQDYSTVADHYLYISMVGVALAAAWAISRMPAKVAAPAATLVLSLLAARSGLQTLHWKDSITLFEHTLHVNPESAAASNSIAAHWIAEHYPGNAIPYARRSVRLRPDRIIGYVTLAEALTQSGRPKDAIECLQAGQDANPGNAVFLSTLAGVLARAGRLQEAMQHARQAVALQPDLADARLALGSILLLQGDFPEAQTELQEAVRLQPTAAAQANLGHALEAGGRPAEAIKHYRLALQSDPDLEDVRLALNRLSGSTQGQGPIH